MGHIRPIFSISIPPSRKSNTGKQSFVSFFPSPLLMKDPKGLIPQKEYRETIFCFLFIQRFTLNPCLTGAGSSRMVHH
jgi:hypothetical protein